MGEILHSASEDEGSSADELEETEDPPERLAKPRDFDQYTYHIPHVELSTTAAVGHKLRYVVDEALADLGFYNIMSTEFWMSLAILLLAMWVRAYMHGVGSWILLKLAGTPVNSFDPMM